MTLETATIPEEYTVQTTGPYPIRFPYSADSIRVHVVKGGLRYALDPSEFSVAPVSADISGDLTLTAQAVTDYNAGAMVISRATSLQQGWAGTTAREKGLEEQLDFLTMMIQEFQSAIAGTLRLDTPNQILAPVPGGILSFDQDGNPTITGGTLPDLTVAGWLSLLLLSASPTAFLSGLGITSPISLLNTIGTNPIVLTDWNNAYLNRDVALTANAVALNRPADFTLSGSYRGTAATGILSVYQVSGTLGRHWYRRRTNNVWGAWVSSAVHLGTQGNLDTLPDGFCSFQFTQAAVGAPVLPGVPAPTYDATGWQIADTFQKTQFVTPGGLGNLLYGRVQDAVGGAWGAWSVMINDANLANYIPLHVARTQEYSSPEQAIVPGGLITLAHGLTGAPKEARAFVICKIAEHGYAVGQIIPVDNSFASNVGLQLHWDTTNIFGRLGSNAIYQMPAGGGAWTQFTPANWRIIIRVVT